jgi:D-alanine-D-alanine ligase
MNVIVLAGGNSDEREVSLRSGAAVAEALKKSGHLVEVLDTEVGIESLTSQLTTADVVFPALHGVGGEDGSLQKFLENVEIPFVGSGSEASALTFDKARFDKFMRENNITTPELQVVDFSAYLASGLIKKPYVLKPVDGGSSIDTFIVRDTSNPQSDAIKRAFGVHKQLGLQTLIEGPEITVAVLGDEPLPVIEIIPPTGGEFDYENKYNGATQEICPPEHISVEDQRRAQEIALKVHMLSKCRDLSRTDIIIGADGTHYVLEINTIPGLTNQSLLPKAAAEAGYSMENLCDKLVQMAASRT